MLRSPPPGPGQAKTSRTGAPARESAPSSPPGRPAPAQPDGELPARPKLSGSLPPGITGRTSHGPRGHGVGISAGAPATGPLSPEGEPLPTQEAVSIHTPVVVHNEGQREQAPPEPMDPRAASAKNVFALFLKTARANQLYPRHSKIRRETLDEFSTALIAHLGLHGETVLGIHQLEISSFEEKVYEEPSRQKSVAWKLFLNGIRSIRFDGGVDVREAEGLTDVLTLALGPNSTCEEIQTAVWERCFEHVRFEISDDGAGVGDSDEYEGFVCLGARDDATAGGARSEAGRTWRELQSLPAREEDDAAPVILTPIEQRHVAEALEAEGKRDLDAEIGDFLLRTLDGGFADEIRGPLEEYFEHLLAMGDVLRAARMLGALRAAAAKSGDPSRARALTDVVERIGRSKVVPALGSVLDVATEEERQGLSMLLTAIGEPVIEPLLNLLGGSSHEHALAALRMLAPKYPKALIPSLSSPKPEIVRAILAILVAAKPPDIVPALVPAMHHRDTAVRRDALLALIAIAPTGATDLLLSALDDPLYEIRATALDALGGAGDPRVVGILLRRIEERAFAGTSSFEKREVFRTLGRIGTPEVTAALARMLGAKGFLLHKEKQEEIRCLAAAALSLVANAGARATLMKYQGDKADRVKKSVHQALKDLDKRAAAAAVEEAALAKAAASAAAAPAPAADDAD